MRKVISDRSSSPEYDLYMKDAYSQLEHKMADLEQQIINIRKASADMPNCQEAGDILDWKIPGLKKAVVAIGAPYFFFLGPSCRAWLIYSMPMFRNYLSRLKLTMLEERNKWLRKHDSPASLSILDSVHDAKNVLNAALQLISSNINAFQEHICYFEATQRPEEKCYTYSDISLIVAVVYLATVFTQHEDMRLFKYPLIPSTTELSTLAFKLLSLSKFRSHASYIGLVALIILSKGLFVFENAEGTHQELESYPTFQVCLNSCYQLGVHSDFSTTLKFVYHNQEESRSRLLSDSQLKKIWNYIQEEDAFYSVMMGYPLLISYDFCNEFHLVSNTPFENKRMNGLLLTRQISEVINSRRQISLRDVCNQISDLLKFCSSLPSVTTRMDEFVNLDKIAFFCKQKLVYLQVLQCLCWMGITAISIILRHNACNSDDAQREDLIQLSAKLYRQSLISAVTSIYIIKEVISGKSIFGTNTNGKYLVFFKDIFATLLGHSYTLWFTFILPEATGSLDLVNELQRGRHIGEFSSKENMWNSKVDLPILEKALFGADTEQSNLLLHPSDLLSLTSEFHELLSENDVIKGSLDSYLLIKSVMVWSITITTKARDKLIKEFCADEDNETKFNMEEYDNIEKMLDSVLASYNCQQFVDLNYMNVNNL
ncbi:hypothetical protein HII13_005382 [Brettanomyces bruxellensis]|nr:hypothetical protein HII13_005382 [Brettanomyces bruxellensis]